MEAELREVPPSAKLVLLVLDREGVQTQQSLVESTRLSERTVRAATDRLRAGGLVEKRPYVQDARRSTYHPLVSFNGK